MKICSQPETVIAGFPQKFAGTKTRGIVNMKSAPKSQPEKQVKAPRKKASSAATPAPFPIVGIGASAGGLEALEQFLENVPVNSGMAFVIVQHLDPTREGIMSELLQRTTGMKVVQVEDGTKVKPDCVYVIPPNKDMSIFHGKLHLLDPTAPRGLRLPIDFFLRSLAQDQQEHSIGVILSGMGSDGTLGLRAIKEKAGLVLVQEPATAKFDGMPRSAINAGLADITAPANELPGMILAYQRRTPLVTQSETLLEDKTQSGLEKVVILLRAQTGQDFSLYKSNTLYRRIERRMGIHQIGKLPDYIRYLQENSQEVDLLFKELLIGVTNFFRDPAAWEQLRDLTLPELFTSRTSGQTLRAWVPGCSTGEEAYSLAMIFKEAEEKTEPDRRFSLQIFASDLDPDAIEKARQGVFPANITADVPEERLNRFFTKEGNGYRIHKDIREMVVFARQNLIMDPPFTKLDVLCCRNLLIYLTADVQKKLMPLFHYSLTSGGILFLGSSETIGPHTGLFEPIDPKLRLFRRIGTTLPPESIHFPSSFAAGPPDINESLSPAKPEASFQSLADQFILQRCAPPAVLANDQGDILYISGRTGKYLEPAAGKANWNLFAMIREELRYELSSAFHQALKNQGCTTLSKLKINVPDGEQCVDITVQQLDKDGPLQGLVLIVFTEAGPVFEAADPQEKAPSTGKRQEELEHELLQARAEVRSVHEEMQTSQEEFRSTNEELQSTNEELQSTNEELTTSKEEMQSLNEELQTVNAELQSKVDEFSRVSNDMKNLLNSTDIATLFLDNDLNVRRFTPHATKIIKLIPTDEGRPVTDLVSDLRYPELPADAQEVLRTLVFIEKPIAATDGRWFSVRIMPYRTLDDRIDGVVITFVDITAAKKLEAKLKATQAAQETRIAEQSTQLAQHKKKPES
jgi:two-component system CheB/CheR fusion protein